MSPDMCEEDEGDFLCLLQRRRPDLNELLMKPVLTFSSDLAGQLRKAAPFANGCTAPIQNSRSPAGQQHSGASRILSIKAHIEGVPWVRPEGWPNLLRSTLTVPAKAGSQLISVPRSSEAEALEALRQLTRALVPGEEGDEDTSDDDSKAQLTKHLRARSDSECNAPSSGIQDDARTRHISASSCCGSCDSAIGVTARAATYCGGGGIAVGLRSDASPQRSRSDSSPNGTGLYDITAVLNVQGRPIPVASPSLRDLVSQTQPGQVLRLESVGANAQNHLVVFDTNAHINVTATDAADRQCQLPTMAGTHPAVASPRSMAQRSSAVPTTLVSQLSVGLISKQLSPQDAVPLLLEQHQLLARAPDPAYGPHGVSGGSGCDGEAGRGGEGTAERRPSDGTRTAARQAASGVQKVADKSRRARSSSTLLSFLPTSRAMQLSTRLRRLRSQLERFSLTPEPPPLRDECSSPLMRTTSSPARMMMAHMPLHFAEGAIEICVGDACDGEPLDPRSLEHSHAVTSPSMQDGTVSVMLRGQDGSSAAAVGDGKRVTGSTGGGCEGGGGDAVAASGAALAPARQTMQLPVRQPQPPLLPYGGILRLAVSHGNGVPVLSNHQRYTPSMSRQHQQHHQGRGAGTSQSRSGAVADGARGGGGGALIPPQPTISRGGLVMQNIGNGEIRGVIGLADSVRPRIQQATSPANAPASPSRPGDRGTSHPRRLPQYSDSGGVPRLEPGPSHAGCGTIGSDSGGAGTEGAASRTPPAVPCLADFLASSGMEVDSPTGRFSILGNCRPAAAAATPSLLPSLKHQKGLRGSHAGNSRQQQRPQPPQPQHAQQSPVASAGGFLVRHEPRRSYGGQGQGQGPPMEGALGGHTALLDTGAGSVTVMLAVTDSTSGLQDVRQHRHYKLGYAPAPTPPPLAAAAVRASGELSPGKASGLLPVIGNQNPAAGRTTPKPNQAASVPFPVVSSPRAE